MTPERFFRIWSSKETLGGATGSSRALNMRRKENEREDSYIRSKGYTDRLTEYSCQFDVINIAGTTWARFKGYTTPFSRFIPRCYEEARSLPEDVLEVRRATTGLPPKGFSFKVFLDASNEPLPGVDPDLLIDHYDNIYEAYGLRGINGGGYYLRSGSLARQVKLAEQLSVSFDDPDDLVVLEMLTTFGDPFWSDYGQYIYLTDDCYWLTYGLLLQRKADRGGQHYRRLGYCYWEDYHVRKRRERAKWDE